MPIINEKYITDERKKVVFGLKNKGYDNATIAKILFRTEKSNISRFFKLWALDFKKYLLENR